MYFLSFVIFFWLYVIIIIYNLTTLCVHDILPFMFMFMFQFVFIFHIIFMFHDHIYTYCISYMFHVPCLWHMAFHILVLYQTVLSPVGVQNIDSSFDTRRYFYYLCSFTYQIYIYCYFLFISTSFLTMYSN